MSRMVQNLADSLGVDLSNVQGTGQNGIITRADVLRAGKGTASTGSAAPEDGLSRAQSAVARAVLKSSEEIPHLYVQAAIDMTAVEDFRARAAATGKKIGYDALFLKALAGGIKAAPLLGARLVDGRVVRAEGIHIALAIGVETDLYLPVVRDVDRKDVATLNSEVVALAQGARANALKAQQMTGGCMALSNLGMYPIESFDPIIFPEHSSILSVGATQRKPVVIDGEVQIRPIAMVKLAVDHRLINGRPAAEFLSKVKEIMEAGAFE